MWLLEPSLQTPFFFKTVPVICNDFTTPTYNLARLHNVKNLMEWSVWIKSEPFVTVDQDLESIHNTTEITTM